LSEAVERTRRSFELFYSGDLDGWLETIHPDIEWDISAHPLPDWPDTGRGRDALLENIGRYLSGWTGYEAEVVELEDLGGEVLAVIHERVRIGEEGEPLERDLHQLWTIEGEYGTRLRVFPTREAAVAAASG
jgi:ketosteroid isomerase-like protein